MKQIKYTFGFELLGLVIKVNKMKKIELKMVSSRLRGMHGIDGDKDDHNNQSQPDTLRNVQVLNLCIEFRMYDRFQSAQNIENFPDPKSIHNMLYPKLTPMVRKQRAKLRVKGVGNDNIKGDLKDREDSALLRGGILFPVLLPSPVTGIKEFNDDERGQGHTGRVVVLEYIAVHAHELLVLRLAVRVMRLRKGTKG